MGFFSAFDSFGFLRFSSEPSQAAKAYQQLKSSYGTAFLGPVGEAKVYASAMAIGSAQCEQDRAAGQFRADRLMEMLQGTEAEYGIVPAPDANLKTRRLGVAAAQRLRNGARADAMEDGLRDILGSAFVAYYVNDAVANPLSSLPLNPTVSGTYKPTTTPIQVVTIQPVVMPNASPQTVAYSHFCGENTPLKSGDSLAVDPGINGICEAVTLLSATATTFSAVFTKPHDAGTIATTSPFENWSNFQRSALIAVTAATLTNNELMRKTKRFMNKWSRIVGVWAIIADDGDGAGSGPFKVGQGMIGHTPIGTVSY